MRETTEFALRSGTEVTDTQLIAGRRRRGEAPAVAPELFLGGNDALSHGVECLCGKRHRASDPGSPSATRTVALRAERPTSSTSKA